MRTEIGGLKAALSNERAASKNEAASLEAKIRQLRESPPENPAYTPTPGQLRGSNSKSRATDSNQPQLGRPSSDG